jgi:hypothetical protein
MIAESGPKYLGDLVAPFFRGGGHAGAPGSSVDDLRVNISVDRHGTPGSLQCLLNGGKFLDAKPGQLEHIPRHYRSSPEPVIWPDLSRTEHSLLLQPDALPARYDFANSIVIDQRIQAAWPKATNDERKALWEWIGIARR